MINIVIRFLLIYFFTMIAMRFLGKRQIGQMQMTELVTAFFMSELASVCITDLRIPVLYGIVPISVMICLEVIVSYVTLKSPRFKRLMEFAPELLVKDGKFIPEAMNRNRISLDELLSMIRLAGYPEFSDVKDVILEANGQISITPFHAKSQPNREEMGLKLPESGHSYALIDDGAVNINALNALNKTVRWLYRELNNQNLSDPKEVFVLLCDEGGNLIIQKKDNAR